MTLLYIPYILFFCFFPRVYFFYKFLVFDCMHMCIMPMHDDDRGHKMGSSPLELELQWL